MVSWKPKALGGHKYSVDDLVELRANAESGFMIVYRVRGKCVDGALNLHRLDINDGVTVNADDVAEEVFPARSEAVAAQEQHTAGGSRAHGVLQGNVAQGRSGGPRSYPGLRG